MPRGHGVATQSWDTGNPVTISASIRGLVLVKLLCTLKRGRRWPTTAGALLGSRQGVSGAERPELLGGGYPAKTAQSWCV